MGILIPDLLFLFRGDGAALIIIDIMIHSSTHSTTTIGMAIIHHMPLISVIFMEITADIIMGIKTGLIAIPVMDPGA
jgi:hypothetical protein